MAKSKYATRNGVCTAKACKRVHLFSGLALSPSSYAPGERMKPIIMANAAKIGITFILRGQKVDRPSSNNPFLANVEWLKHVPDPSNYFDPLLAGAAIVPSGNLNYSLVGITPGAGGQARREGQRQGRAERGRRPRAVRQRSPAPGASTATRGSTGS